jgi:hypothetical protein
MTLVALLRKWLVATPIAGKPAVILGVAAVAFPTLYRMSLDGIVMGIGYCPYLPFVLLSAVLLGWWRAALIALVSVGVVDALFVGTRFQLVEGPTDMLGDLGYLFVSVLIIALVQAIRTAFDDLVGPTATDGVFFSLDGGQAWASWPTAGFHLRLGSQDDVTEMMRDFIAQVELGKRLSQSSQTDEFQQISPARRR